MKIFVDENIPNVTVHELREWATTSSTSVARPGKECSTTNYGPWLTH